MLLSASFLFLLSFINKMTHFIKNVNNNSQSTITMLYNKIKHKRWDQVVKIAKGEAECCNCYPKCYILFY